MSITEENTVATLDITNTVTLNDLIQRLEVSNVDVSNVVQSVTYDRNSRTIILHFQSLLEQGAEEVDRQHSADYDSAEEKIRKLSERYKLKYPEILTHFKQWKPLREALVRMLGTSINNLERNSSIVSGFRIFTSAADILGTLLRHNGYFNHSLATFCMENASVGGVVAILLEMFLSKKIHANLKGAIKEDQAAFEKIIQWFKQTNELDATVRSFFPYGIDKDIVKKIHLCSSEVPDYQQIFLAVFSSNVKQNVKLFKNKQFLTTAERFSTSEAGKLWFNKVLLENDHFFVHTLNSSLSDEIQALQKISPTENRELYIDAGKVLSNTVRMKVLLNTITIFSSVSNLCLEESPERYSDYEKLQRSTS